MSNTLPSTFDVTPEALKTLSDAGIIPPGTPPAQVKVFAEVANRHGLDPFTKEVHLVGYGGKYSVIVGINGMRARASDTGLHAGIDAPQFNVQPDGSHHTLATLTKAKAMPETCTATVYKIVSGHRVGFTATVSFKEFSTGRNKWQTMPYQMIMKVAESHALRKAFPRQVSGLYLSEEMEQTVDINHSEEQKETLTTSNPAWAKCVRALMDGYKIDDIKKKYDVTKDVAEQLVQAATEQSLKQ